MQREARLPGFRKGKVPRSMIKLHFSDDVKQEVARSLIPEVYRQALDETRLKPVEEPDLQEVTLEENAPLSFSAVVEIKPAIALGAYTGLAVTHAPKPLGDEEVDEAINHFREQHAEFRAVERTADLGDLVIMDYTLTPEGMDAREEKDYSFLLGQGSVLPEIEEAVIGLAAGGSRNIRLKFADDHRNEALRGKSGEATVTVKEVKEKILPAVDDEFAKGLGAFETVDALKEALRKDLQARRDRENRHGLEDAVVEALLASHEFQVPGSPGAAAGRPSDRAHARAAAAPGRGPRPAALGLQEAPRGPQAGRGEGGEAGAPPRGHRREGRPGPGRRAGGRRGGADRPGLPAAGPGGAGG